MTSEQLEAARAERMRQNGNGTLTLEDARTWIEETGLCLFLPRRQFSSSVAPSFVEAVSGRRDATPHPPQIAAAEELLVRLELDGVAVRLNLLGQPGEQPDFVVAGWVLPYVYALRGDRDWRRNPQLTGSRQVSPLAVQTYKLLEAGDTNCTDLTHALGREVTEAAVMRAIAELWQQLRIIPVIDAPGKAARWQLLRTRFQKAIAEGASTSQVTAISVLASIYLQAVIAATMEDVEIFLSSLTARSKVREVLRGLVATRQVHTISLGHAPHFYVAGTLPEFSTTSLYANALPSAAYYLGNRDEEEEYEAPVAPAPVVEKVFDEVVPVVAAALLAAPEAKEAEIAIEAEIGEKAEEEIAEPAPTAPAPVVEHKPRLKVQPKPAIAAKPPTERPRFARPTEHSRERSNDRKPSRPASHSSQESRPARHTASDSRTANSSNGSRPTSSARSASGATSSSRAASSARWSGKPAPGGTDRRKEGSARPQNGLRPATQSSSGRSSSEGASGKPAPAWSQRKSHGESARPAGKSAAPARSSSASSKSAHPAPRSTARPGTRPDVRSASARPATAGRSAKPAGASVARPASNKRFSSTARPSARPTQGSKKRG